MGLNLVYQEGQSPLSEEEKEGLKIKTIFSHEELDEFEQKNIEVAVQWIMSKSLSSTEILSERFIKNLHRRMFSQVWSWAGKFRRSNKNIGVDKAMIIEEIKKLLDDCYYWINNKTFSEAEIAIRFKHRLVYIHPFPNGNGRHARLMADIIMEKIFKKSAFSWGGSNLNKSINLRITYIKAIRKADEGDYSYLLNFARS